MTPLPKDLPIFDLRPFLTKCVLVVDDEPEHLMLLSAFLEDDWSVLTASSGAEAVEIVRAETLDVVVADQRMPGMSGVELLKECARIQPDTTRIMLTAWSDSTAMIGAINEGKVYRFLQKPWQPHILHEALTEGAERCAYRRAVNHLIVELQRKNAALQESLRARKEAEETLLHAERLATIGQLTSGVVHEVRNYLQIMQALLEEVQDEENLSDGLREFLVTGILTLEATYHSLDDVNRFARRREGPISRRAPADVNELARRAVRFARLDARLKFARVVEDYGSVPLVSVDGAKVQQVLQNLLRNAADALPDTDPYVGVCTSNEGAAVRITVEDNGGGVPLADRERIWQPFFSTKDRDALGLGLHICREIMTAHGGDLTYAERPGGGARFVVTLPLDE